MRGGAWPLGPRETRYMRSAPRARSIYKGRHLSIGRTACTEYARMYVPKGR